jgi:hypothetical protein
MVRNGHYQLSNPPLMSIQRLDEKYIEGQVAQRDACAIPKMTETHTEGTFMVPPEFIQKRIDLIREAARWDYSATKPEWMESLKKECKRSSKGELLLVPFSIADWKYMCEMIIKEVAEKPELTKEAMVWTRDAIIAQFMDETGLSEAPRMKEFKRRDTLLPQGTIRPKWESPDTLIDGSIRNKDGRL